MAAIEQGSRQGLTIVHGDYRYESYRVLNTREDTWYWRRRILPIYRDFDKDPFSAPDEVKDTVRGGMYIDIVMSRDNIDIEQPNREEPNGPTLEEDEDDPESHPEDVAYVVYQLKDALVAGRETLATNMLSKVVLGDHQQHGVGTDLTKIILARHHVQVLTAETGNPFAYLAHKRSGYVGRGYALDGLFGGEMYQGVKQALGERLFSNIDDFQAGLCIENYLPAPGRMRRRQIFDIEEEEDNTGVVILKEEDNPDAFGIMKGWKDLGMKPRRRDEMRYWFEVDSTKVPTIEDLKKELEREELVAA